jgi:hypothetical protein
MDKINNILRRLNNKDIREIKEVNASKNYISYPKFGKDGKILPSQWKAWQTLQRYGLGYINGDFEASEFKLSELGKELVKEIK